MPQHQLPSLACTTSAKVAAISSFWGLGFGNWGVVCEPKRLPRVFPSLSKLQLRHPKPVQSVQTFVPFQSKAACTRAWGLSFRLKEFEASNLSWPRPCAHRPSSSPSFSASASSSAASSDYSAFSSSSRHNFCCCSNL